MRLEVLAELIYVVDFLVMKYSLLGGHQQTIQPKRPQHGYFGVSIGL
jgi:hypothetical protein